MGRPKRLSTPELMRLGPGFSPSLSEGSSDESVKLAAETRNRLSETRTTVKKLRNKGAIPNHNLELVLLIMYLALFCVVLSRVVLSHHFAVPFS